MDNVEREVFIQMCIEDAALDNMNKGFVHHEDALEDLRECENLYNEGLWC